MSDAVDTAAPETDNPADTTEAKVDTQQETAVADVAVSDDVKAEVKPDWPEDWRDKLANGDEKFLKRLGRFKSPLDVTKSWLAAESKISSGEVKATLPDDASEDQIAAYRKDNGIPEKPEGYIENLPDGLVIGEDDKELVGSFLERAHGKNADPAVVADMIDWYYGQQEDLISTVAEADKAYKQAGEDTLRAEMGAEYRGNYNAMQNFLSTLPTDSDGNSLGELLMNARLGDGKPFSGNPMAIKWMMDLAEQANPAGFIAPGSGLSQIDTVQSELAEIRNIMRTDRSKYNKDEKMQARYLKLIEAEQKLNAA